MKHPHIEIDSRPEVSGRFIEAISETAVALAIVVAICVGLISLSVHLNEVRKARAPAVEAAVVIPSSSAGASTRHSNIN